jgi:hypothetical protein
MAKHPETLTEEQRVAVEWALGQRPLPFDTGFSEAVDDFVKRNPPGFARPGIAEAWEQFQRQRAGGSGDHVDLPPEYANGAPVLDEVARAKRQWPAAEESALGYLERRARESTPVLFPVLRRVAAPDRIAREMFRQAMARHPRLEQVVEMGRGALQELLRCAGVSSIPRVECMVLAPYRPDEGPRGTSRPLRGGGIEPWEQTSPHTPR